MQTKKLSVYMFLLAMLLAACSKKAEFEDTRVDVRLSALLAEYEQQLIGAENGWLGYLYPEGGGGYTFRFVFRENNRVLMYSDMNAGYASSPKESSFRLRATQVPSLYFDTYSYLHELADPDPDVAGGGLGEGHLSDFEFSVLSATVDTIRLKGNLNGSEMVLVRANSDQGDDYISKAYAYNQQINKLNRFPYYYNRFTINGRDYNLTINTERNTVSLYSSEGGFTFFNTPYACLDNGLVLQTPFTGAGSPVTMLTNFDINETTHTATVQTDAGSAVIRNEQAPLVTDPDAAQRMYVQPYQYASDHGFTVEGVQDGLGLGNISGFVGVLYIPRRFVDGYDAFSLYYDNGEKYVGPVLKTRVGQDGRMFFYEQIAYLYNGQLIRDLESVQASLPPGAVPLIHAFSAQLVNTQGYYVYQTGKNYYDLVSVADPRVWVRFY